MPQSTSQVSRLDRDPLGQYVHLVGDLNRHLQRISEGTNDIAGRLSRAAAALRSIAQLDTAPVPDNSKQS